MRENRSYGLEGGESGSTGLPYPYRRAVANCRQTVEAFLAPHHRLGADGYALKVTTALRLRDGKDRSS